MAVKGWFSTRGAELAKFVGCMGEERCEGAAGLVPR